MEEALGWDASSDFNKMRDLNPGSLMLELEKHNIWCYTVIMFCCRLLSFEDTGCLLFNTVELEALILW